MKDSVPGPFLNNSSQSSSVFVSIYLSNIYVLNPTDSFKFQTSLPVVIPFEYPSDLGVSVSDFDDRCSFLEKKEVPFGVGRN